MHSNLLLRKPTDSKLYVEDVFSTYLYTGNGSTQTISNGIDLAGKGGLVWLKARTGGNLDHVLYDTARTTNARLITNTTAAQTTQYPEFTSFNSNGFSFYNNIDGGYINQSGLLHASWTFRKAPKFFDVVTYTGNGTSQNISHNLGSVPGFIIVKNITSALNWATYHRSLGAGYSTPINSTSAALSTTSVWNSTEPTSTQFTVGSAGTTNEAGSTHVAYLFAHDAGGFGADGSQNVISCGSFTIDGSGTTSAINLGYEPQFLLTKLSDGTQTWLMNDSMRGLVASSQLTYLQPNSSAAEVSASGASYNPSATGFKPVGFSAGVHIYVAIRRGPMRTPTSGTSVFSALLNDGSSIGKVMTTGFVVDSQWANTRTTNVVNTAVNDRLRSVSTSPGNFSLYTPYLQTAATAAEDSSKLITNGWNNTGFLIPYESLSNNTSVFWNFQRAPGFMDVVCYTGTGSAATINHNLGVVPEMIIVKGRSGATDWPTYHIGLNGGVTPEQWYVRVNSTTAQTNAVANWNNTAPTSTVFSVGGNNIGSGTTFVAYLFATCPGVSKVGSYTGTGATQTISCGFTGGARFVLIKRADGVASWWVWDTARGMVAGTDPRLALNNTNAEANANWVYTTTGGFQIVTSDTSINASGGTYIYLAIA